MAQSKPTVSDMLVSALGGRVDPGAKSLVEMMFEDFVMEFPYARPGVPTRVGASPHRDVIDGSATVRDERSRLAAHSRRSSPGAVCRPGAAWA